MLHLASWGELMPRDDLRLFRWRAGCASGLTDDFDRAVARAETYGRKNTAADVEVSRVLLATDLALVYRHVPVQTWHGHIKTDSVEWKED